ncbi:MAG: hypothetical protein HQK89_03210 [Nitrospirae bacterium]|nr:hypothetical protein [Nitrospirota bacterium]
MRNLTLHPEWNKKIYKELDCRFPVVAGDKFRDNDRKGREEGFALVITMLFALIGLALSGALLFMVIEGSKISGIMQRYSTALDAGKGASEDMMNLMTGYPTTMTPGFGTIQTTNGANCIYDKLSKSTLTSAGTYQWTNCTASQANTTSTDPTNYPDIISDLGNYRVYSKITDTEQSGTTSPIYMIYTVVTLSQKINNPSENAQITYLFRVTE